MGKFFLIVEIQLINIKGMIYLEKSPLDHHHNYWFRQESPKNTKIREQGVWEARRYLHSLKVFSHKILMTKGKRGTLQWRNPADSPLNQVIKVNTNNGTNWHNMPPDMMNREGQNITSVGFLPREHNLNWIMRKYGQKLSWGAFYKIADKNFPNISTL